MGLTYVAYFEACIALSPTHANARTYTHNNIAHLQIEFAMQQLNTNLGSKQMAEKASQPSPFCMAVQVCVCSECMCIGVCLCVCLCILK